MKRSWPKFPLNAPWPVLDYLVRGGESLREHELVWKQFRDSGSVIGYGSYIGQIAQYPDFVKARKLQPFDFAYDTYPMRLKDGGVCGTMSNIGRFSNSALGVPAIQAGQPGHSCFVAVGGNDAKGYGLSIGQAIAGPESTSISGRGAYVDEAIKFYPVNYGLQADLDSEIAVQLNRLLPAGATAKQRVALLQSALAINPYNRAAATAIQEILSTPGEQVEFCRSLEKTLAGVDKPGCPKAGYYNNALRAVLNKRLAELPVPPGRQELEKVAFFLADHGDSVWLKYQVARSGLPVVRGQLTADLEASIAGTRTSAGVALLAQRLGSIGAAIKDRHEKKAWGEALVAIVTGHETYTNPASGRRKAQQQLDPCANLAYQLAGRKTPAQLAAEEARH